MDKLIVTISVLLSVGIAVLTFPDGFVALFVACLLSAAAIFVIRRIDSDRNFLVRVFLGALIVRIAFGTFVYVFDLQDFFGNDATTYDWLGRQIVDVWLGQASALDLASQRAMSATSGWGMNYLVAVIYLLTGGNHLAGQFFCSVIGAATVPAAYFCSHQIFHNERVSKVTALIIAFFPSLIIWSSQLLKDGLIIFLLVLTTAVVLHLQKKFSLAAVAVLIFSLIGVLSLRFYIFYMLVVAVAGSLVLGQSQSVKAIIRGFALIVVVGLALTYMGVLRDAGQEIETYGSLERIQSSRGNLAESKSGFGRDLDVSTTKGAIAALPIGFLYLMLAPFPWQVTNLRQAITLPEIIIWWSSIPFLLAGLWYTLKNRLRSSVPILIFTAMLTTAYSIFQGNVGTAYRQRAQIQVFLFIFVAVGWTLWKEKKENKRFEVLNKEKRFNRRFQERV